MSKLLLFSKTEDISEPQINITPLIDVVFVILIAFILVAPLLELDRIRLANSQNVPSHEQVSFDTQSPLQISVQKDNTILLNKTHVTIDQLRLVLCKIKEKNPDCHPLLFHDKEAYFGTYQEIKNALENAGFEEVDVVLLPS